MLWVAFALMTGAAILCALWPLSRRRPQGEGQGRIIAFHKAQLAEIERDIERGQLPPSEAAGARAEAARRLIAASEASQSGEQSGDDRSHIRRRASAVAILILIPVVALGLYLKQGKPNLPDQPILARAGAPAETDLDAAIAKIEAHLLANPTDGRGFAVIAPAYMHMRRFDEAAKAYESALRLLGENPHLRADYGEALTAAAGGIVTAQSARRIRTGLVRARRLAKGALLPRPRRRAGRRQSAGDRALPQTARGRAVRTRPGRRWCASIWRTSARRRPRPRRLETRRRRSPRSIRRASKRPFMAWSRVWPLAWRKTAMIPPAGCALFAPMACCMKSDKAKDALAKARAALAGNDAAARDLDALAQEFGL